MAGSRFTRRSWAYPKTLAIVLGVLQNTYSSPKDGYKIFPLSVADVDNLGKHLEKQKGQNDPRNRCILDILDRISTLEGLYWDDSIEQVARLVQFVELGEGTGQRTKRSTPRRRGRHRDKGALECLHGQHRRARRAQGVDGDASPRDGDGGLEPHHRVQGLPELRLLQRRKETQRVAGIVGPGQ